MKIDKQSWHYRFNAKIQRDTFINRAFCGRHTTCSYIRTTLYSVVQGLWFAFLACFCAFVVAVALGSMIWVPISIFFLSGTPAAEFAVIAFVMWVAVAILLGYLTYKFMPNIMPKRDPYKEPNVFFQAIKDQHNKVCTRVEVV